MRRVYSNPCKLCLSLLSRWHISILFAVQKRHTHSPLSFRFPSALFSLRNADTCRRIAGPFHRIPERIGRNRFKSERVSVKSALFFRVPCQGGIGSWFRVVSLCCVRSPYLKSCRTGPARSLLSKPGLDLSLVFSWLICSVLPSPTSPLVFGMLCSLSTFSLPSPSFLLECPRAEGSFFIYLPWVP